MKALLIIDMQRGCFRPYESRYDTAGVISRINELSDIFRKRNYPVIFIRHDGTSENELIPHSDDWKLLPELTTLPGDLFFDKTANDSFYRTELEGFLKAESIDELYITGAATDFCIDVTVKSALNKDYKVCVLSDCHTTEDKENLTARLLIEHYNWIWSALAPAKHKVRVIKSSEVVF